MAYAGDLKSPAARLVGSSPTPGTKTNFVGINCSALHYFEQTNNSWVFVEAVGLK